MDNMIRIKIRFHRFGQFCFNKKIFFPEKTLAMPCFGLQYLATPWEPRLASSLTTKTPGRKARQAGIPAVTDRRYSIFIPASGFHLLPFQFARISRAYVKELDVS